MTIKTNFTPGPWEARYSSVIDVEKDEIIAVMTCGSVYRKNELEDYDTARFIAAAPDGYALAKLVMEICGNPKGISERDQEELYEVALQYTNKARGET